MNETKSISLYIDGRHIDVSPGTTVLEAGIQAGIEIPTLCHVSDYSPGGVCRFCVVRLEDNRGARLVVSCSEQCGDGIRVFTKSNDVIAARREILRLILSEHKNSCFSCERISQCVHRQISYCNYNKNCFSCWGFEKCLLRKYCIEYEIDSADFSTGPKYELQRFSNGVVSHDPNICVRCRRCLYICRQKNDESIITITGRGTDIHMQLPYDRAACAKCGKCIDACPTGAMRKT